MRVLVTEPIHEKAVKLLKKKGYKLSYCSPEQAGSKIKNYDIIVVRSRLRIDKEFLEKAVKLKYVIRPGVGLDNIDLLECKKLGIEVFNSPGSNSESVAELALGLIIACMRSIAQSHLASIKGRWRRSEMMGFELMGKKAGIIGYGAIGKRLGQLLKPFKCQVLVYDPLYPKLSASLKEIYRTCDVISLHLPLNPSTRRMIGRGELGLMKKSCVLINTSRGGVIDEKALIDALKRNKIMCAGLDVFETEPRIRAELRRLKNVVLTQHLGSMTNESYKRMSVGAVQNFLKK